MPHRLEPLLNPSSLAVIGASERPDTPGREIINNLLAGRFAGALYAVNPRYTQICGVSCHSTLAELPEKVEQVYIAVGDAHVESALEQAIEHGAKAVVVICSLAADGSEPPLMERVRVRAREAGILLMGGNTMGYYNFTHGTWACAFDTRNNHVGGGITLITHSGAGMSGLIDCDERLDCNLAVSTGQELDVRMDEYLDYALEQAKTRVVGLFMETARSPHGLRNALRKARDRKIPVVVLKVGKTAFSARLAESHSGAMAGRDDAFQALFDRYGVIRVSDMDEFTTALIMFNQPHPVAPGALVSLHDSGGERQLLVDLADEMRIPLAELSPDTTSKLEQILDPGLPAVNPLDAWSAGGPEYHHVMEDCMAALMCDPAAAFGAVIHDRAPNGKIYTDYFGYMRKGHAASGKPVFLVSNRQGTGSDRAVVEVTREGFPVLDGLRPFLAGVQALTGFRDYHARTSDPAPVADELTVARWRRKLANMTGKVSEQTTLQLLGDFEIPACQPTACDNEQALLTAASELGFPLVLKTAKPGVVHKSDVNGVHLDIANEHELRQAYGRMVHTLGPEVIVMPMVQQDGVEMAIGMINDAQFGPLVMLGFGGRDIESSGKVRFLLAPFGPKTAKRAVKSLAGNQRLRAWRGRAAVDVDAFCQAAANFSAMAHALASEISELDANPVIVHPEGCIAVDGFMSIARPDNHRNDLQVATRDKIADS